MKKFTLLSTLVIIAALALGACTSTPGIPATGSNNASPTSVSSGTPAAAASPSVTGTANASGASSTATSPANTSTAPAATSTQPAATSTTAAPTSAASATSPAAGNATSAAPTAAQTTATSSASSGTTAQSTATAPAATAAATGTSAAGTTSTPQAGASQPQFLRLTNLMNVTVQTSDAQPVGAVNSVVVDRPSASASSSANSSTVTASTPVVRYVVVNLDSMSSKGANGASGNGSSTSGTGNQVIVPWQAFKFNNLVVGQGSTSQTASASTLTMNVSMSAFATAPRVDVAQVQNNASSNWQSQSSQFWTSQGLNIPNTGNASGQPSNLVFIGKQMNGFNVVGANNAVLGQVADFLVNIQTGEIAYAVITPQGMNGQSFYIPLSSMSWQFPVGQNSMTTLGNLVINITPAILQNAPSLGSLNNLKIDPSVLQQLNQFWQGIQSTPTK